MNGYGMIRTFGVVVLLVAASVLSASDAKSSGRDPLLTTAELGSAFHPDKLPTATKLRVRFSATGKAVDTYLNPSEGQLIGEYTKIFHAYMGPDEKPQWSRQFDGVRQVMSDFFAGAKTLSTHPVSPTKSGDQTINGTIGDLIIQPLPVESPSVGASRVNGSTEKTIYPSLLVRTNYNDPNLTRSYAGFEREVLYQIAFWNAVDLLFRQVKNPKIRLRIAGIMIGQHEVPDLKKLAAGKTEALNAEGKHWYKLKGVMPFEAYDIVMTMTDFDMYKDSGSRIGIGKKSFCMPPSDGKHHAVGIFRDNHDFSGISHAAYALSSIFGVSDDTASGDECDASKGFIMRPDGGTGPHYMEWSPCSLTNFSVALKDVNCADNPARGDPPGPKVQIPLPGDLLPPDELCKVRGFDESCDLKADTCSKMECKKAGSSPADRAGTCETIGPAPDGTNCGAGRKCLNGNCECVTAECMYCKVKSSGVGA